MKIKKSKHKKVKVILNNELVDFYISHEEIYLPIGDFDDFEEAVYLAGWTTPVKPMSLKNTTKIIVLKTCVLFEK